MVFGSALGVTGALGVNHAWPERPIARGVLIGGQRPHAAMSAPSWLEGRRGWLRDDRHLVLRAGDVTRVITFAEAGIDVDIETTVARAAEVGHRGRLIDRAKETLDVRRERVDVPIAWRISEPVLGSVLESLAKEIERGPKDARLVIAEKRKIPDEAGRRLDLEAAKAAVAAVDLDASRDVVVDLPVDAVRARVTLDDLARVEVDKVLSTFETTYATFGTGVGRSANIVRAASLIDGTILPAGEVMSFNDLVGPRTLERGFAFAPEIQGDELTTGVGGGTCQVSTTLYAAAVFGALEIPDRKNHSRVSSYAKLGLDATVSYPTVDLKIRNPFPYAIMLHAFTPKPGVIKVEILGGEPAAEVTYAYGVGGVEDFVRRITVKSHLKPGTQIRRQKGVRGYDVTSVVTIKWRDGRVEERKYYSGYRPSPEVFWVAPGYDEAALPPLPDHAKGVEGRLADGRPVQDDVYGTL